MAEVNKGDRAASIPSIYRVERPGSQRFDVENPDDLLGANRGGRSEHQEEIQQTKDTTGKEADRDPFDI
jgi:hypothetical protein